MSQCSGSVPGFHDKFYESICAPQFYDFLNEQSDSERDSWFASHNEGTDVEFHKGQLLPEETFDKMTPPKARSPHVAYPKPSQKIEPQTIQIPKFLADAEIEEEEEELPIPAAVTRAFQPKIVQASKPKKKHSTLTVPVSPFFHTSNRARRGTTITETSASSTIAKITKTTKKFKLTEPQEFSFSTLKRAITRNARKNPSSKKESNNAISRWTGKLTEPREFNLRTEARSNLRKESSKLLQQAAEPPVASTQPRKFHLTEPQSPFLHTKRRAQLKRKHSELLAIPHQGDRENTENNKFSAFDRDHNLPPRKRFRNSLTEPKPFHFQTEVRSIVRTNSRPSVVAAEEIPREKPFESWSGNLTEPKEFSFATAQRAALRETKAPVQETIEETLSIFDGNANRRKRASSLSRDSNTNLTQPRPFNFQTEQRALHKVEQNKVRTRNQPAGKRDKTSLAIKRRLSPIVRAKLSGDYTGVTKYERQVKRAKSKVKGHRHRAKTTITNGNRDL